MIRLDNGELHLGAVFKDILLAKSQDEVLKKNFVYTGSGKAALSIVLQYLRQKGILQNKMAQILVPQWMGIAVYQTLLTQSLISPAYTEKTSAVIAYHQYGFPQNMSKLIEFCYFKRVVLIEDCAHVIDSKYKGQNLGTFGEFSIYSFSKFCFCFALGGVYFKDDGFLNYFKDQSENSYSFHRCLINSFKLIDEYLLNYNINFQNIREILYGLYPKSLKSSMLARRLYGKNRDYAIKRRKENYNFLWNELGGYGVLDHLEKEDVVPYATPLLLKKNTKKIIEELATHNIKLGEYWFDINRFVVEPNFVKTLLLPMHSNVSFERLDFITKVIKKYL